MKIKNDVCIFLDSMLRAICNHFLTNFTYFSDQTSSYQIFASMLLSLNAFDDSINDQISFDCIVIDYETI